MTTFELADADATAAFGAALGGALATRAGAVIFLIGDLGAGKTTLVRGLLRSLGVTGAIRSPTYTLLEPYETASRHVLHIDLYRLLDPLELENLGLADFPPAETLWLVEWPERGAGLLPTPDLEIELLHAPAGRRLNLRASAAFQPLRDELQYKAGHPVGINHAKKTP